LYPLFWKTIEDAVAAGDRTYDFGRTAADNPGLCEFKKRWGTTQTDMPYYFDPPSDGVSVVKSGSLKYRLFTGAFRRMPTGLAVRVGERIFRHFG
jgi:lipid II:glycine glycyltransferase (peptidoglycan interpeptide bridge formation enzyme)